MSAPSYIRFTLRLPPVGAAGWPDVAAPPATGVGDSSASGARVPPGAAAEDPACRTARAAAELLAGLPTPGWQDESDKGRVVFWLPAACIDDSSVEQTLAGLAALGDLAAAPESAEWESRWRDFHHPVTVGRILVRPPWAPPDEGLLDVVIDVGMAFGTGGHATTRQCLQLLQSVAPGSLLDVGCGSGVLSIAACRLGFNPVEAVDVDELATAAAAANALFNGVTFALRLADATSPQAGVALHEADVLVANVALRPVVALGRRVDSGGAGPRDVILAGLLTHQVEEALGAWPRYRPAEQLREGDWTALHLRPARRRPGAVDSSVGE